MVFVLLWISSLYASQTYETVVSAPRVRPIDEKTLRLNRDSVDSLSTDETSGRALARLPGATVRNNSGPGSLTTVTLPGALNAGSTAVSIDSIPIVDPIGIGFNYSLIPQGLIRGVDALSPFYPALDPQSVNLPAPGGRVNLRTQASGGDERPLTGSAMVGSANTAQGALVGRGKLGETHLTLGGSLQTTKGNFSYREPESGIRKTFENNDSTSGSLFAGGTRATSKTGRIDAFALQSQIDRTNPGPIGFPGRDHERDTLTAAGAGWTDPEAFTPKDGAFAKASGTISRVQNMISDTSRTDAHTAGAAGQGGYTKKIGTGTLVLSADALEERLNDGTGLYNRVTTGVSPSYDFDIAGFRLIPYARVDHADDQGSSVNGTMTLERTLATDLDLSLSAGILHQPSPIIASRGYFAGSLVVLPNPALRIEQDDVAQASLLYDNGKISARTRSQVMQSFNRATYVSKSFTQAKYENVPRAQILSETLDFGFRPLPLIGFNLSSTITRAWDRDTGREFPYKPRLQGLASVDLSPCEGVVMAAEEEWLGKRLINFTDDQSLSPYAVTHARVEFTRSFGTVFARVSNVFDGAGYASAGYALIGRSFFVGYHN